jgi:hypothetical protein
MKARGLGIRSDLPTNRVIAGVALWLFCSVLVAVAIHHVITIGNCSSTGYSSVYGPVAHCPSGSGWIFALMFGGIIGIVVAAGLATSIGLIIAGIFGSIGFGALSILFSSGSENGDKLFAGIFGGVFGLVGVIGLVALVSSAISALRAPRSATSRTANNGRYSHAGGGRRSSRNGSARTSPIVQVSEPLPSAAQKTAVTTPADLIGGLRAAAGVKTHDSVDELTKLANLHQSGALTDEEFASAKAKLLARM